MGVFGPFIPLWLGGDEYDEDPVTDLPDLKQDLYGVSGKPGGWMYGSVRNWTQLETAGSPQQAMLADSSAMLHAQAAHSELLHHNICSTHLMPAPYTGGVQPALVPYIRWLPASKAVLIAANSDRSAALNLTFALPLQTLQLAGYGSYQLQYLYGGPSQRIQVNESSLSAWNVTIAPDGQPQGGLVALLITPSS